MNNNTGLKVSVLMLTYNQERYINEAIRSVMLQETNFPFELVIGNDASTDCTGTICADWQKKYPEQIVLFNRKKNLGLQQNFIQTYTRCRGQYIAICEGDDFWTDKRKLQIQADFPPHLQAHIYNYRVPHCNYNLLIRDCSSLLNWKNLKCQTL